MVFLVLTKKETNIAYTKIRFQKDTPGQEKAREKLKSRDRIKVIVQKIRHGFGR
jgi:hypothetical protein